MSRFVLSSVFSRSLEVASRKPPVTVVAGCLSVLVNYQQERYAGHSKWQNIRHTKAANDAKKGSVANKFVHLIRKIVIESGPDPKINSKLGELMAGAFKAGVSKPTVERAVKRASEAKIERLIVEMMAPGGAFLLVDIETDLPMDAKYAIKQCMKKFKGQAGILREGTAKHAFVQRGIFRINKKGKDGSEISFEKAEEIGIEVGAEEVKEDDNRPDEFWLLETDPNEIFSVKGAIEKNFSQVEIVEYEIVYVATSTVQLSDEDLEKASELCDALNEIEDVNRVYANIQ